MTVRLTAGTVSVGVEPTAGGRLSSLVIDGRERLVTEPDPSAVVPAITWGSFAMLPWVGRLSHGRLAWRGTTLDLPRNFGAHAIHGATFDCEWNVLEVGSGSVELGCDLGSTGRWPFDAEARQSFALLPDALELRIEVRARVPMPLAVGWHPWFQRLPDEPILVRVPGSVVLETTEDLIPTGNVLPVTAVTDLRMGLDIADRRLDHTYVDVQGPSVIAWTDLELAIEARPLRSVVVYTTPFSVCIEPQSGWPDAIRLDAQGVDAGLASLAAGDTFVAESRWSWRTRPGDPAGLL